MSKTPVTYEYRFSRIEGANGDISMYDVSDNVGYEIAKRVNMHNELVAAVEMLIPSFIHESYTEDDEKKIVYLYELLERCK